jgi:hypothetical protein
MPKRIFKFSLRFGALIALGAIVFKLLADPSTPQPEPIVEAEPEVTWVEPQGSVCPTSHPIKAKLSSKVFRGPNSPGYATSRPDRCYASEDAARADGLREAKR